MSPHGFTHSISVIIPALNEEEVIGQTVQETARALACDYEILVVDDGSSDRTFAEAQRALRDDPNVRVLRCERTGGKGQALHYGFGQCSRDLVAFLDADLDLHPRQLRTLYRIMQQAGADVVIGSKRHPDSQVDYPWHRKIISTVYFWIVKALFGLSIRDTQTGIKLFRYEVLADAFPRVQTRGYAYDLELLVAATRFGYRIAEAPVELSYQRQSLGRIGMRSILAMSWDTLRIFYRASFWNWLSPANATKFWMVAFAAGLVTASFGVASALTFLPLPAWMSHVSYYGTLKFMPRLWRNLLLLFVGLTTAVVALIQLNKSVMRAFAHTDDGDLAGILAVPRDSSPQQVNGQQELETRDCFGKVAPDDQDM